MAEELRGRRIADHLAQPQVGESAIGDDRRLPAYMARERFGRPERVQPRRVSRTAGDPSASRIGVGAQPFTPRGEVRPLSGLHRLRQCHD